MSKNKAQASKGGGRNLKDLRPLAAATLIGIVVLTGWVVISYFEEPIISTYRELTTSKKVEVAPVVQLQEEIPTVVDERPMLPEEYPIAIEPVEEDPDILESEKPDMGIVIDEVMAEMPDPIVEEEEEEPAYTIAWANCKIQAAVLNDEVMRLASKLECEAEELWYLKEIFLCSSHTGGCAPYRYSYK